MTGPDRKGGTKGIRLIITFEFCELLLIVVFLRLERTRYSLAIFTVETGRDIPVSNNR